jgi:very-short-patch-repair endonuclease
MQGSSPGDAARVCGLFGGVATTALFHRYRIGDRALAGAVQRGLLVRPRRGCYALPGLPAEVHEALAHGGQLCCAAAARAHGLWVLDDTMRTHVWLGPDGRAHAHADCRCIPHRDVAAPSRGGIVSIEHCLAQMLGCCGEEAFFAALESALRQRKLGAAERARLRGRVPERHRWLVDFAQSDADSGLESLVRLRLHRRGVSVRTQVPIPGVGTVDFVIGDCLILEADGGTHEGEGRHRDLVRDAVAMTLGFIPLRYDYALIVHEWDLVEHAVLSALGRGLHLTARRVA